VHTGDNKDDNNNNNNNIKPKLTLKHSMNAQRGVKVQLYSFYNLCARWGVWWTTRSGRFIPRKVNWYSSYRLGGRQSISGWMRTASPPPGFDPGPSNQ